MKKISIAIISLLLLVAGGDLNAQNKKKTTTKKTTTSSKSKSGTTKKKVVEPVVPEVKVVELPYNSNDCLFAVPIQVDKPYGPTTAPDGAGRMLECVADKNNPNLFDREHNSVWYKFTVPYNGQLEIEIVQENVWDDYDFLLYKNTGVYFSNQVIQNKVLPVAVNLSAVDSNALAAEALKQNQQRPVKAGAAQKTQKAKQEPAFTMPTAPQPTIGMKFDAKDRMLTKKQMGKFIKSIPVRMGEEYYLVLDNRSNNGKGHTIKVSVHVDAYEPLVLFYDKKQRRYIDVNLMLLERDGSGNERPIVQEETYRGRRIKFVPGFNYTLYAKRDGYFSVYREFSAQELMMHDTVMLYQMERTERGSTFQIRNVDFEFGEANLIGNPDSVLMDYVAMFRNHPDVNFMIKGYVTSYGVNAEADMLLSLDRAKSVKDYFVKNGIEASRMTTTGMTKNEIKRAAAAVLDGGGRFSDVKIELIITGKDER